VSTYNLQAQAGRPRSRLCRHGFSGFFGVLASLVSATAGSYGALLAGRAMSGLGEAGWLTVAPPILQDIGGCWSGAPTIHRCGEGHPVTQHPGGTKACGTPSTSCRCPLASVSYCTDNMDKNSQCNLFSSCDCAALGFFLGGFISPVLGWHAVFVELTIAIPLTLALGVVAFLESWTLSYCFAPA